MRWRRLRDAHSSRRCVITGSASRGGRGCCERGVRPGRADGGAPRAGAALRQVTSLPVGRRRVQGVAQARQLVPPHRDRRARGERAGGPPGGSRCKVRRVAGHTRRLLRHATSVRAS